MSFVSRKTEQEHAAARTECQRRHKVIMEALAKALTGLGATVELRGPMVHDSSNWGWWERSEADITKVNGRAPRLAVAVKIEACFPPKSPHEASELAKWSMSRASTITLDRFCGSDTRRFVEGKNGFKYDEIAKAIIQACERDAERDANQQRRQSNYQQSEAMVARLRDRHPAATSYSGPIYVTNRDATPEVELHVYPMSVENALKVLQELIASGGSNEVEIKIKGGVSESVADAMLSLSDSLKAER